MTSNFDLPSDRRSRRVGIRALNEVRPCFGDVTAAYLHGTEYGVTADLSTYQPLQQGKQA